MTKAERLYYDRGYRAGQKKAKKEAFDEGWKSAHDEFNDYLKKEHYDKGYSAGKKAGEAKYAALEAKVLKQDQATRKDAYNKGYSAGYTKGKQHVVADHKEIVKNSFKSGVTEGKIIAKKELDEYRKTVDESLRDAHANGYKEAEKKEHEKAKKFIDEHLGEVREKAYGEGCDDTDKAYWDGTTEKHRKIADSIIETYKGTEEYKETLNKILDREYNEGFKNGRWPGKDKIIEEYKGTEEYAKAIDEAFKNGSEDGLKKCKHTTEQLKHADKALAEQEVWFNRKIKYLGIGLVAFTVVGFILGTFVK